MAIKKLTSRISTVLLERELLAGLMQNKFNLQRYVGRHSAEFFTSDNRSFIYEMICKYFNDRRTVFSREDFDFEVQKRLDPVRDKMKIDDVTGEFDVIKSTSLGDGLDVVIAKLNEVKLAESVDALVKDAYELLEQGKIEDAAGLLRQKSIDLKDSRKEGQIINLHADSDDWFQEVRNRHDFPEKYTGVPTGFEKFDRMTGGLFPAELTIVFGLSGKGKSTFMKAMSTNIRKQGRVVLHCGNEENEFQMRSKYMSADSGEKYSPFKRGTYTDEEYNRLKAFSDSQRNVGAIYVYEFPQQTDVTWIERAYRNLEMKGVHVDVIVVDYLDLMKPIQQAYNENDEQGKVTSDLKQLAINCNCPVLTATQAGTQSEKQERKTKPFLTAADVFGTKRKVHSANCLIGIVNQTATVNFNDRSDDERKRHKMVLCVPKNRDGPSFTFRQIMEVETGRFYEDTDEDDPLTQNLEKQAHEMMTENPATGEVREEIDTKELMKAAQDDLGRRLSAVTAQLGAMDSHDGQAEESADAAVASDSDDGFLSEAPDAGAESSVRTEEGTEADGGSPDGERDDFLSEAPDSDKEEPSDVADGTVSEPAVEIRESDDDVAGPSFDTDDYPFGLERQDSEGTSVPPASDSAGETAPARRRLTMADIIRKAKKRKED